MYRYLFQDKGEKQILIYEDEEDNISNTSKKKPRKFCLTPKKKDKNRKKSKAHELQASEDTTLLIKMHEHMNGNILDNNASSAIIENTNDVPIPSNNEHERGNIMEAVNNDGNDYIGEIMTTEMHTLLADKIGNDDVTGTQLVISNANTLINDIIKHAVERVEYDNIYTQAVSKMNSIMHDETQDDTVDHENLQAATDSCRLSGIKLHEIRAKLILAKTDIMKTFYDNIPEECRQETIHSLEYILRNSLSYINRFNKLYEEKMIELLAKHEGKLSPAVMYQRWSISIVSCQPVVEDICRIQNLMMDMMLFRLKTLGAAQTQNGLMSGDGQVKVEQQKHPMILLEKYLDDINSCLSDVNNIIYGRSNI